MCGGSRRRANETNVCSCRAHDRWRPGGQPGRSAAGRGTGPGRRAGWRSSRRWRSRSCSSRGDDPESRRQPLHDPRSGRKHRRVHRGKRRRPRRHQESQQRPGHSRSGENCHRQAGHDDHQYAYPWRSQRQQRVLPNVGGDRHSREHRGEHAEDAGISGRRSQARPAGSDLHGSADASQRERINRSRTTSARLTPTATRSSSFGTCA